MTTTEANHPCVFLKFPGGIMRPIEEGDAKIIYRWCNDPELRPYFNRTQIEFLED